ncbi:MAG: phosphoribosylformylglycinamide cyclo-ligase [Pseudomonadota bacterium]
MLSYKDSGVDISAGNELVERIKPLAKSTTIPGVLGGIGSFSGAFEIPSGYKNPVMMAATDGVGTKLRLAIESGKIDSVGIDLVAMCVNDLICNFAEPAFFLDYYATGKLSIDDAERVVAGIANGCKIAECALIGGETAEMPGMYEGKDFDLAGFAVGLAEKEDLTNRKTPEIGDVLVALPSSGVHSNGYSLVRKLLFDKLALSFDYGLDGKKLIDILMEPTKIYVKEFKKHKKDLIALAHITGGGITENLPRVLPDGISAKVDKSAIKIPEIFKFMAKHMSEDEAYRTFNMGIGMVWVVKVDKAEEIANSVGGYIIGELISGNKEVVYS